MDCADEQATEEAAEAVQLRRKLLLIERRRAAAQRTAAMLAERGLTLPPDLPRTPQSAQPLQPTAAEAPASRQRPRRSRLLGFCAATAAAAPPDVTDAEISAAKRTHSPPHGVIDPPVKRQRTEPDRPRAAQQDGGAAEDAASPATTEIQDAGDSASTEAVVPLAADSMMLTVDQPDPDVIGRAAASRNAVMKETEPPQHSAAKLSERGELLAGGVNGSMIVAAPQKPVRSAAAFPPSAPAEPAAVSRSSEKLLAALLAADAAPAVLNVKARAGPMLAVSRTLTGFGDLAAKVQPSYETPRRSQHCYACEVSMSAKIAIAYNPAVLPQAAGDDADVPLFGIIAKRSSALGLRIAIANAGSDLATEIAGASEILPEARGPYRSPLLCFRSYRCCCSSGS